MSIKQTRSSINVDFGKLATIFAVLLFLLVLTITDHIPDEVLTPFLTLIVGYTFGNGALAFRGKKSQPMLRPSTEIPDEVEDTSEIEESD